MGTVEGCISRTLSSLRRLERETGSTVVTVGKSARESRLRDRWTSSTVCTVEACTSETLSSLSRWDQRTTSTVVDAEGLSWKGRLGVGRRCCSHSFVNTEVYWLAIVFALEVRHVDICSICGVTEHSEIDGTRVAQGLESLELSGIKGGLVLLECRGVDEVR